MTEETTDLHESLSTLITESNTGGTGGGAPPPDIAQDDDQADDKSSIADVLRKEAKAQEAAAKEERKAEKAEAAPQKEESEAKPEAKAEVKEKEVAAQKPDEAGAEAKEKPAQSEGRADRIPSRLLPKEREVWANVPNAVKAAWERMEREHAEVSQKYEPAAKLYEELREFDELAKRHNTTIKDALTYYQSMDTKLKQNLPIGLAEIVHNSGKNPVEAVAGLMRAMGVLPQQLGAYLQGQPVQPVQQPQQAKPDPVAQAALQEVQQLKAQMAQQEVQSRIARVENDIVTPFATSHPRFEELQSDIAMFLNSGKIPTSLSPVERLEVAYDMAERINPAPVKTSPNLAEPAGKPPVSDAGKKSVRGAPASGQSSDADFDDETDLVALLRKEARKLTA